MPGQYDIIRNGCQSSAKHIVEFFWNALRPKRVVDIGCGEGHFLAEFKRVGAKEIFGLDGLKFGDARMVIAPEVFAQCDLEKELPLIGSAFDLALCLEVAEHLTPERAESFVAELCKLAPIVVFSAAIPKQGGINHINEQWPEYWVRLFQGSGFDHSTIFRSLFWNDERVEIWYRQNLLVFQERKLIPSSDVREWFFPNYVYPINVVHPFYWSERVK